MNRLLGVLDAYNLDGQQPRVAAWAQAYGLDPRDVHRIELYYDGRLTARVYEWDADEHGRRYCPREHSHTFASIDGDCEFAERQPYNVTIIGAAGPQAIRDRVKARADVAANACPALAPVLAAVRAQVRPTRAAYGQRRRARVGRNR